MASSAAMAMACSTSTASACAPFGRAAQVPLVRAGRLRLAHARRRFGTGHRGRLSLERPRAKVLADSFDEDDVEAMDRFWSGADGGKQDQQGGAAKLNVRRTAIQLDDITDEVIENDRCRTFIDRNGDFLETLCCDYGFREGVGRMYEEGVDGTIPSSAFELGMSNFKTEYDALRRSFRLNEYQEMRRKSPDRQLLSKVEDAVGRLLVGGIAWLDARLEAAGLLPKLSENPVTKADDQLPRECRKYRDMLDSLVLSNDAVWQREEKRDEVRGPNFTPPGVRVVYLALCYFLDFYFDGRPIQRFWFLETVARMPYFSYSVMLTMYESLGWWRAGAKLRKVHFAEEWNELHHLMIMESLGGDRYWLDRFMAGHAALVYFVILCGLFFFNPKLAYNFSELIEGHAVDTYGEFVDANETVLRELPPPYVAASYYTGSDLYLFDFFQTYYTAKNDARRPACRSLYDVFSNIRDDEGQHVETMAACQDQRIVRDFESIDENIKY